MVVLIIFWFVTFTAKALAPVKEVDAAGDSGKTAEAPGKEETVSTILPGKEAWCSGS